MFTKSQAGKLKIEEADLKVLRRFQQTGPTERSALHKIVPVTKKQITSIYLHSKIPKFSLAKI